MKKVIVILTSLFSKDLVIKDYYHLDDRLKSNNCISDHLAVMIEFKFE